MLNIVLFGPPGSGKGTQAENIIEQYELVHISTGDILRAEVQNKTELGLEAKEYMDQGLLVPDKIVTGMLGRKIDQSLENGAKGFVFDGFPRTVGQAVTLDRLLRERHISITKCLALDVSEEELTQRILKRGASSKRADDKNESIIRQRVAEYRSKTSLVASYYDGMDKLVTLKGEGSIEETFELLKEEIDQIV